jgi:hypothetical protein
MARNISEEECGRDKIGILLAQVDFLLRKPLLLEDAAASKQSQWPQQH